MSRWATRIRKNVETAPVAEVQASIMPASLRERLTRLSLPSEVINLIVDTTYVVTETPRLVRPLFALGRHYQPPHDYVYNYQEVQEVIRLYDHMKGIREYTETGQEVESSEVASESIESPILSDEQAIELFRHHVEYLKEEKERRTKLDILVPDALVYESPLLQRERDEEARRVGLLHRKKRPIKGIHCAGCNNDEVYQGAEYSRAGDESAVWHYTCAKCDRKWKVG